METDISICTSLELKRRVLEAIKEKTPDSYPSLGIKPIFEVLSYKTSLEAVGGGHLEGATHMARITRQTRERAVGFGLISGNVYLYSIAIQDIVMDGQGIDGIKGLKLYGCRDIEKEEEIPRKGWKRIFGPQIKQIYGPLGLLLAMYVSTNSKDRMIVCQRDSKLEELCKAVLLEMGQDTKSLEVNRGLYDDDRANFFQFD